MAKKKRKKKPAVSKPIEIYKHKSKRKNNPHVGGVTSKRESPKVKAKKYQYDSHLDPLLQWAGKAERTSFEVPSVSLHVHEKIDPRSIIETVRNRNSIDYEQLSLFQRMFHFSVELLEGDFMFKRPFFVLQSFFLSFL